MGQPDVILDNTILKPQPNMFIEILMSENKHIYKRNLTPKPIKTFQGFSLQQSGFFKRIIEHFPINISFLILCLKYSSRYVKYDFWPCSNVVFLTCSTEISSFPCHKQLGSKDY